MSKIFRYELKRLLLNKFFIVLLIINGLFAWYILATETVVGVAYTAPFSPWSFGDYLSSVMPLSILTVLFLMTTYYSKNEKQTKILTDATPVNQAHYILIRSSAVALGFTIICAVLIGLSFYFYATYFGFWKFASFILPAILTLPPCLVLTLGLGHLVGYFHSGLLYALMLISMVMGYLRLGVFDFFGKGYYAYAPYELAPGSDGEPAFTLSAGFLTVRILYLLIGLIFFAVSIHRAKRKSSRV